MHPDPADHTDPSDRPRFADLALSEPVLEGLQTVGYESPSPIQAATIPHLLAREDVVGQAQTGTGKTAAFALPILSLIDLSVLAPQGLVLAPTRELAIQVAEAFRRYASRLPGFHVLPIYGGQSYTPQLQSLKRGVHVVVGTPGRIMDHMKRGSLELQALQFLVLDEADEMLQMGFIDDVEWVLERTPSGRTIALFSATLPPPIRRIAQQHLRSPIAITIKSKTVTAANIRQRYWLVSGMHKLDALTRILEAEPFDGMIVFTRTKQATVELAERLEARGFAAEPLNGDILQAQRERTVARLKSGQIDIVVATDVAARGLDVERVSHVINFDVPYDAESYVHRIGRTGRAGRSGEAILFIAPRERNMLRVIERATRQPIDLMKLPTVADVNERRIERFKRRITDALSAGAAEEFQPLIEQYEREHNVPAIEIAAALAQMMQGKKPLLLPQDAERTATPERLPEPDRRQAGGRAHSGRRHEAQVARMPTGDSAHSRETSRASRERTQRDACSPSVESPHGRRNFAGTRSSAPREGTETYRIEVGHVHGVKPSNIVGAIANEAGLEGRRIGGIDIREDHSFVELPQGMPKETFRRLQKVRVAGQQLQIGRARKSAQPGARERKRAPDARKAHQAKKPRRRQ